jgi:hypothetical protein
MANILQRSYQTDHQSIADHSKGWVFDSQVVVQIETYLRGDSQQSVGFLRLQNHSEASLFAGVHRQGNRQCPAEISRFPLPSAVILGPRKQT